MAAASVLLVAFTAEASDKKCVHNRFREGEREWPGLGLVERESRCLLSAGQVLRAGRRDPACTRSMSRKFPAGRIHILSEHLAVHVLGFLMQTDGAVAVAARMCCNSGE